MHCLHIIWIFQQITFADIITTVYFLLPLFLNVNLTRNNYFNWNHLQKLIIVHTQRKILVSHIPFNPKRNHIALFLLFISQPPPPAPPSPQWWMSSVCLLSPNVTSWLCSESWWVIKALDCPLSWPLQQGWSHEPDRPRRTVFSLSPY